MRVAAGTSARRFEEDSGQSAGGGTTGGRGTQALQGAEALGVADVRRLRVTAAMEDRDSAWWLDPETGDLWVYNREFESGVPEPEALSPDEVRVWEDHYARLERVPVVDSAEAYRDMEDFAEALRDGPARSALLAAMERPRPFRRFKDALDGLPEDRESWFAFHGARMRSRAQEWLGGLGIEAQDTPGAPGGGVLPAWLE